MVKVKKFVLQSPAEPNGWGEEEKKRKRLWDLECCKTRNLGVVKDKGKGSNIRGQNT